jgi:hypothetical protein
LDEKYVGIPIDEATVESLLRNVGINDSVSAPSNAMPYVANRKNIANNPAETEFVIFMRNPLKIESMKIPDDVNFIKYCTTGLKKGTLVPVASAGEFLLLRKKSDPPR